MRRLGCLLLPVPVLAASLTITLGSPPAYAADPVHTLSVASTGGAAMYPAYSDGVDRYGITTTSQTGGAVTLNASTSDPGGRVLINGRPKAAGPVTVSGLEPGDEISVIFEDAGGAQAHGLIYLPSQFPALSVTADLPGQQPGVVGLTLSKWFAPGPNFETAVDRNGVPIYVYETTTNGLDLKRQPNGELSVSRPTSTAPGAPYRTVMLGDDFVPTGQAYGTVGLVNTDGHDSTVFPDGSRLVIAYEQNNVTGKVDSVIQRITAAGAVDWQWDSSDFGDESVVPTSNPDYAHINSVQQVGPDDDVIASFRHFSSVYRIATKAHDGYAAGDVIWKLGGRDSTFDFVDDPDGGPCAQHTAYQVSANHILLFDNRTDGMCVDQSDPTGPTTNLGTSRVTEYALDTNAGTATLVWSYEPDNYNAFFAGSSERLSNGNTLVGWAAAQQSMASEVNDAGTLLWNLVDATNADGNRYFTYRAAKFDLGDAEDPVATVTTPAEGATYTQGSAVTASFQCTDRGGSMLAGCDGTKDPGAPIDTSTLGAHTFVVTAADGAGNEVEVERHYTVAAAPPARHRPDVMSRATGTAPWTGANTYGGRQNTTRGIAHKRQSVTTSFAVQNDGNRTDTMRVLGTAANRFFRVRYFAGSREVTGAVTRGEWRTRLDAGRSVALRVVITRTAKAGVGRTREFGLRAVSLAAGNADRATVTARATRS